MILFVSLGIALEAPLASKFSHNIIEALKEIEFTAIISNKWKSFVKADPSHGLCSSAPCIG